MSEVKGRLVCVTVEGAGGFTNGIPSNGLSRFAGAGGFVVAKPGRDDGGLIGFASVVGVTGGLLAVAESTAGVAGTLVGALGVGVFVAGLVFVAAVVVVGPFGVDCFVVLSRSGNVGVGL